MAQGPGPPPARPATSPTQPNPGQPDGLATADDGDGGHHDDHDDDDHDDDQPSLAGRGRLAGGPASGGARRWLLSALRTTRL